VFTHAGYKEAALWGGFRESSGPNKSGSVSACLQISLCADRRLLRPGTTGYELIDPSGFLTRHESPPFKRATGTNFVRNRFGQDQVKHDLRHYKVNNPAFSGDGFVTHKKRPDRGPGVS
jgi:hypothetical protein